MDFDIGIETGRFLSFNQRPEKVRILFNGFNKADGTARFQPLFTRFEILQFTRRFNLAFVKTLAHIHRADDNPSAARAGVAQG